MRGYRWHRSNGELGAGFKQVEYDLALSQEAELTGQLDLRSHVSRSEKKNDALPTFRVLLLTKASLMGLSKLKAK